MIMPSINNSSNPSVSRLHRKTIRVLVVNVFFDDWRQMTRSPNKVPQATAPTYLAGVFRRELCDVQIYNEHQSGPLTDKAMFAWPDLLVLTGLNVAFDRMLHLTAYVRSKQPRVRVVAGGHAVRAMPRLAAKYFDWACTGDIESLATIIKAEFGTDYVADTFLPRYDLVRHNSWLGYTEASRNCNFKCSFCTLTGEHNAYLNIELETLRTQILSMGYKRHLLFLDNNFYGSGKRAFAERMAMLRELFDNKRFGGWSAMVTHDFFLDYENLELARQAGCVALFSGVESFDEEVLRDSHKRQNTVLPQFDVMYRSLDAGILFHYGLILDLSTRYLADVRNELEVLFGNPHITLPSFLSLTIPLIGTPFFSECVSEKRLLPNTKLRDCDGFTLTLRPRDPMEEAVKFVRNLPTLTGYRRRIATKAARLLWRYSRSMTPFQLMLMTSSAFLLSAPNVVNAPFRMQSRANSRTCVTTTEAVDPLYRPLFPVEEKFRKYFEPTYVTDVAGELSEALRTDFDATGQRLGNKAKQPRSKVDSSRARLQLVSAGE